MSSSSILTRLGTFEELIDNFPRNFSFRLHLALKDSKITCLAVYSGSYLSIGKIILNFNFKDCTVLEQRLFANTCYRKFSIYTKPSPGFNPRVVIVSCPHRGSSRFVAPIQLWELVCRSGDKVLCHHEVMSSVHIFTITCSLYIIV